MTHENAPQDEATLLRRERRRLLIGAGVAGSVVLTVPSRSVLAGTITCTKSVWASFSKNPKGFASHATVTANFGDAPATWRKYVNAPQSADVPPNWATLLSSSYSSVFGSPPNGTQVRLGSNLITDPTVQQCLGGNVTYKKGNDTYNPQQAVCAYINALYYVLQGVSYFHGKTVASVKSDFSWSNTFPTLATRASTYGSSFNVN